MYLFFSLSLLNSLKNYLQLNVIQVFILFRHIAGLGQTLAERVVELREIDGPFVSRHQLLMIKGIGPSTFKQIAGFIRVFADKPKVINPPGDSSGEEDLSSEEVVKIGGTNLTGKPEIEVKPGLHNVLYPNTIQYNVAKQILRDAGAIESEIGKEKFICAIKSYFLMACKDPLKFT